MRVFKTAYTKHGSRKKASKWGVDFSDHRGIRRRIAGFTDKDQTSELGRKIEKLVAARANNEPPDAQLRGWLESMPHRIRLRLVEFDLISRARMAASPGQFGLPATDYAGDHGFFQLQVTFVVAAWLDIHHRPFAAVVLMHGVGELLGGKMDVDILSRGQGNRSSPACGQ